MHRHTDGEKWAVGLLYYTVACWGAVHYHTVGEKWAMGLLHIATLLYTQQAAGLLQYTAPLLGRSG